jgi:hypothetical protein
LEILALMIQQVIVALSAPLSLFQPSTQECKLRVIRTILGGIMTHRISNASQQ